MTPNSTLCLMYHQITENQDPLGQQVYAEYHAYLESAKTEIGRGLLLDLHGQNHQQNSIGGTLLIHCIFYENIQHFIGPIPEFHDNDPQSLVTCTSDQNWTAGSFQQAGPVWPPCWEGADSPLSNWSPARVGEQPCLCSSHTAEGVSVILLSRYESSTLTFPLPRHPQYPPKIQREPWCTAGKIWLPSSSLSAPAWPGRPEILQVGDSWSFTNMTRKLIHLIYWYSMPACSFIFFRGGFITQTHGSCHGGEVDAIQMEVVFKFSNTPIHWTTLVKINCWVFSQADLIQNHFLRKCVFRKQNFCNIFGTKTLFLVHSTPYFVHL